MKALYKTNYHFPGQTNVYHGKVRDVYTIGEDLLIMVATDRISAFDVVLDKGIPFKGQVLNQLASKFFGPDIRHCSELETRFARPQHYHWTRMQTVPRRNGDSWLFDRTCLARV